MTQRDDGYSGTSFDRPAFLRLLRDIEAGEIGVVLTKDLSRLGRDYIETGRYLERWFPEHNVRYIAVGDGVDTGAPSAANEITPFKAVINDFYARDISKKVRAALDTKRACGRFIGARAPYGYQKDARDKNRLVPNEAQAQWVRKLFALFLGGETLCGVARRLNAEHAPSPGGGSWSDATVRRILTSPTYAGDLTQRRTRKVSYKVQRREALPPEEWLVVEHTHAALIPRADFEAAQALLQRRARHARTVSDYPLAGLVYCGVCGRPMTLLRQGAREYLVCSGWKRGMGCEASRCVRTDAVLRAVRRELAAVLGNAVSPKALAQSALTARRAARKPDAAARALRENREAALCLYRDRASGVVSAQEYVRFSQAMREEEAALCARLEAEEACAREEEAHALNMARKLLCEEAVRETLLLLVERVTVGQGRALTVRFAFREPPPLR